MSTEKPCEGTSGRAAISGSKLRRVFGGRPILVNGIIGAGVAANVFKVDAEIAAGGFWILVFSFVLPIALLGVALACVALAIRWLARGRDSSATRAFDALVLSAYCAASLGLLCSLHLTTVPYRVYLWRNGEALEREAKEVLATRASTMTPRIRVGPRTAIEYDPAAGPARRHGEHLGGPWYLVARD